MNEQFYISVIKICKRQKRRYSITFCIYLGAWQSTILVVMNDALCQNILPESEIIQLDKPTTLVALRLSISNHSNPALSDCLSVSITALISVLTSADTFVYYYSRSLLSFSLFFIFIIL